MQKGNRAIGDNKAPLTAEQKRHKQKMEALAMYYKKSEELGFGADDLRVVFR